jgi:hypothetical protein
MNARSLRKKSAFTKNGRQEMSRQTGWFTVYQAVALALLLAGCTPETGGVGPQGPVGSQGSAGAGPVVGTPGENVIVIESSGNMVTQQHDLSGFDSIEVGLNFDVDIRQGDEFLVTTSVDENIAEYIIVAVEGNTLSLDIDDSNAYNMMDIEMQAEIVMPSLESLVLDLAGDTTISGFQSASLFNVVSNLSGTLQGDIQAGDINIESSISGKVDLSGSAADLTVQASGSSIVDLADMTVANADVTAEGGSTIIVNASDTLDASVSFNSQVYYIGSPTLGTIETATGGVIEQTR